MLKYLLALLASFLTLGVDPPDGDPDPDNPDLDADGDPDGDGDGDADPDNPDGDPDPDGDADPDDPDTLRAQLAQERTAREKAEREHREAVERAAAAERARHQPAPRDLERELFEHEEQRLKDPAITDNERWQIQSNRTLRSNERTAREALSQATDMSDRAGFARLMERSPVLKKYESRVEERLAEIRKGGRNMARELIARFLIGEDVMNGKVQSKRKAPPASGSSRESQGDRQGDRRQQSQSGQSRGGVDRGRPPTQRGDVRGRHQKSEAEKRRERLDGQQI